MNLNAERLEAVATRLEKLPEPDMAPEDRDAYDFDMRRYSFSRTDYETGDECFTPACVAGHICFEAYRRGEIGVNPAHTNIEWEKVAAEWVGANLEDEDEVLLMDKLFCSGDVPYSVDREITPRWAAACLRKLKDTGKVDWEGTRPPSDENVKPG